MIDQRFRNYEYKEKQTTENKSVKSNRKKKTFDKTKKKEPTVFVRMK
ncbi:hypothetical protein LEP1GSC067_1498 [Leptospira interrogans serovar Lora str. TE 1992]|uniref:Uncharacterized protein n=1 Tax=Leptospira interrogans serovar Lora str. TE 1992 TaxID=1193028 RepID=M3CKC6_LEPIR|nr:hypothetical protein LEP1GSC067_1498 [Leptospira interrogans serovar Lora str. TE 1992]